LVLLNEEIERRFGVGRSEGGQGTAASGETQANVRLLADSVEKLGN
jgi:hypothetical protein